MTHVCYYHLFIDNNNNKGRDLDEELDYAS